jgi:circadian clock protein KaiC
MGRPGTGKTTLANQVCFSHAARGGKAVYFTLLAESHARMLSSLQSMRFFDPTPIGDQLIYLGGYVVLRESRLPGLLQLLRRVIRDERATLLVVDGLATAQAMSASDVELREFIAELQALSSMSDCTTVLLANLSGEEARGPEHSMVDGLIELTLERVGERAVRELEVMKFRGSNHFMGRHDLEITDRGIVVRPRTEDLVSRYVPGAPAPRTRLGTGIAELDRMLGSGLLSGSSTLLLGFSGSGKTTLGLEFLVAGAARGEPGLYFGFYESPERLLESGRGIGPGLGRGVEDGSIELIWQPPLRFGLDELAERVFENVRRRSVKRLVIDGLDGFRQGAVHPSRTLRFVSALLNMLRSLEVTTMLAEETQKIFGPEVEIRVAGLSGLVDNIVLLEYVDVGANLRRVMSVVKERGSAHDTSVREFRIVGGAIEIEPDSTSADELLGGISPRRAAGGVRARPAPKRPSRRGKPKRKVVRR